MRRDNILPKMFPTNLASARYHSAVKQTAGLIKSKAKKGEMWAIKKINETIKIEINEGKVKRIDLDDFKRIEDVRTTNF